MNDALEPIDPTTLEGVTGGGRAFDATARVITTMGHDAQIGAAVGGVAGATGGAIVGGIGGAAAGGVGALPGAAVGAWSGGQFGITAGTIIGGAWGLGHGVAREAGWVQ